MPSSIDPLPLPAPSRATQSNPEFSAAVDALLGAFPDLISQINQVASEMSLVLTQAFTGTSTTSVAIGTGAKSFTTQADLAFSSGQWVIVARQADPSNYMLGQVTDYNNVSGVLQILVLSTGVGGSGTFTDWSIGLVPQPVNRSRSNATTSFSSPLAFNSDNYDIYSASAQAANLTINADAGTPVNGRKIVFDITCDATPRTITFTGGAAKGFMPVGVGLNVSGSNFTYVLTASKTTIFAAIYNAAAQRWRICGFSQED